MVDLGNSANKQHRHWLWYAFDTKRKQVLAYTFGPRNDETCRRLLSLLSPFQIGFITSDDWGSYAREVPSEMHLTGKIFTQRIERNNLTLRTDAQNAHQAIGSQDHLLLSFH